MEKITKIHPDSLGSHWVRKEKNLFSRTSHVPASYRPEVTGDAEIHPDNITTYSHPTKRRIIIENNRLIGEGYTTAFNPENIIHMVRIPKTEQEARDLLSQLPEEVQAKITHIVVDE